LLGGVIENMRLVSAFWIKEEITKISPDHIETLKVAAMSSELRRARICLHHNHEDQVQEMLIVF